MRVRPCARTTDRVCSHMAYFELDPFVMGRQASARLCTIALKSSCGCFQNVKTALMLWYNIETLACPLMFKGRNAGCRGCQRHLSRTPQNPGQFCDWMCCTFTRNSLGCLRLTGRMDSWRRQQTRTLPRKNNNHYVVKMNLLGPAPNTDRWLRMSTLTPT